jgi:hypothetical protein
MLLELIHFLIISSKVTGFWLGHQFPTGRCVNQISFLYLGFHGLCQIYHQLVVSPLDMTKPPKWHIQPSVTMNVSHGIITTYIWVKGYGCSISLSWSRNSRHINCINRAMKELSFTVNTCIQGSFSGSMSWKRGSQTLKECKITLNGYILLSYFHL